MFEAIDEERNFVVDWAIRNKKGTKEEIELYEEIMMALEMVDDGSFRVEGSRICNGLDFHIITPYPNGLPFNVGSIFFNVDTNYDVKVKETPSYTNGAHRDPGEMNFSIKVKKF